MRPSALVGPGGSAPGSDVSRSSDCNSPGAATKGERHPGGDATDPDPSWNRRGLRAKPGWPMTAPSRRIGMNSAEQERVGGISHVRGCCLEALSVDLPHLLCL